MVVACPACQTRYRVDAALVVAGETSFECCQEECGHVFVYTPPVLWKGNGQESEPEPPSPPSQPESAHENPPESDPEDESGFTAADSPGRVRESQDVAHLDGSFLPRPLRCHRQRHGD